MNSLEWAGILVVAAGCIIVVVAGKPDPKPPIAPIINRDMPGIGDTYYTRDPRVNKCFAIAGLNGNNRVMAEVQCDSLVLKAVQEDKD